MPPVYDPSNPSSPLERRRSFRLLFICLVVTGIGNSMLFAILPPLARDLGVAEAFVGAIYTISALLFLIMSPIWGALSDRYGRRPLIIFGLSAFAASTLVFALATVAGQMGWAPPLIAIFGMAAARALFGGFGSATNPAAQAYVADRTSPEERTEALAGLTAAFGLGGIVGPALAAAFVDRIGIAPFMVAVAILVGGAAFAIRMLLPENTPPRQQSRPINPVAQLAFAFDKRVAPFFLFGCGLWLVQAISLQAIGFYVMDRMELPPQEGLQLAGVALTAGAGALIFAQLVVIPAMKASPRALMTTGAILTGLASLEMVFAANYGSIVFGYMLGSFAFGLARSGFTGGASIAVEPEEQGRAAGSTTATAGLGFLVAPVAGLWLYQAVGPETPYMLNVVLAAATALLAWLHPGIRSVVKVAQPDPEPRGPI
ncbi:MFS transporter [Hyphobacterium sp. HN65]|uniref:MFS transporter n=1 Tax=Hyphobacterium lacteum TaxID=3116575 RepID=A0ABU7LPH6_9PROT|nr:MFS transporter [Hyphobacterium sp. HN65]MEE2525820.1 MFS transporter [Hyphobacterium sp. HN65]